MDLTFHMNIEEADLQVRFREILAPKPCEIERRNLPCDLAGTAFNVICKVGPSRYKRHTLVLSDNTSAFVEQLEPAKASAYHYRVTFRPQTIIPDIDFRGDAAELTSGGE